MTQKPRTNRRTYMKTLGILGATGLGSTGLVTAKGNGNGARRQLEEDSSFVAYSVFVGSPDNIFLGFNPDSEDQSPLMRGDSDSGPFNFDTTIIEITPNEKILHYVLRFVQGNLYVNKPKPYVLREVNDKLYSSEGALVNFEITSDTDFGPLQAVGLESGKYRATIRDKLHLYEDTSYFDWAITRADFFKRGKGGMNHELSLLYVVWDEDGSANEGDKEVTRGSFEELSTELPSNTVDPAAELVSAGVSNPGGK